MINFFKLIINKFLQIFELESTFSGKGDVFNITINNNITTTNNYNKNLKRKKKPSHDNIGDVKLFAGNEPPHGWFICDGQLLPILQYADLFAVIGTIYGGDGEATFALPDLRGRTPVGVGKGIGLTHREIGENFGSEKVILNDNEIEIQGSIWQPKDPGFRGLGEGQGNIHDIKSITIDITSPSIGMNYIIRWKCK